MISNWSTVVRVLVAGLLAVALLAGSAGGASAQEIVYGSTVPAGTTVDQDIILTGDDVRIDGTVLGDVIAVGGNVTLNGRVDGTLITIAQDVELNGEVGGSLFAAALQLVSGPAASVGRNVYFAGLSLVLPTGATVGRDLVAATLGATLGGDVRRDVRAIVGPFEFARLIIGAAEEGDWVGKTQAWWESVKPEGAPEATPLPAPTVAPSSSSASGSGSLMRIRQLPRLQETPTPQPTPAPVATSTAPAGGLTAEGVLQWLQSRLLAFIPLACLGLVVLWLFPPGLTRSADRLRRKPLPTWLWGFLVFVVANQLFVVAAILTMLVVVVGLAIGLQSMWGFAFSIWAIGLPGIGLAVGLLAVALYGFSVVIPGYAFVGSLIDPGEHYLRRAGVMLLGVLAFVLLVGIPILGPVVWAAAVAAGSGAMFFAYTDWRQRRRQAAEPLPVMKVEALAPPPAAAPAAPPPLQAPVPVATKSPAAAKPARKARK
jgi:cytoskeletal protein CcmA (bactofilin family)